MKTTPDVFIIESLDPDDEDNDRLEGKSVAHLLKLHDKQPIYCYVRTKRQFRNAINKFKLSKYRYLHISAHGDKDGICTTNQDEITYSELASVLGSSLRKKRLFLSACSTVHKKMAARIIPNTGCYSIVGPSSDIAFSDAVVFWPLVYHLMFAENDTLMSTQELKSTLQKVNSVLDIEIGYYSKSKKLGRGYTGNLVSVGRK